MILLHLGQNPLHQKKHFDIGSAFALKHQDYPDFLLTLEWHSVERQ